MANSAGRRKEHESDPLSNGSDPVTRRNFLSNGMAALAGITAVAAAASPLRHLNPDDIPSLQEFLQKHYKELTPEDKEAVFERVRQTVKTRYDVDTKIIKYRKHVIP